MSALSTIPWSSQFCAEDGDGRPLPWSAAAPWVEMPEGGVPYDAFGVIATPVAGAPETIVTFLDGPFIVPVGMDGVIHYVSNLFTGPGFNQGSGDLVWRLRIGAPGLAGRPVRNYSNIRTTLGSLETARIVPGGLLIRSTEEVTYTITHSAASPIVPAGTRIIVSISGWLWPR